jgi:hypothetical protein
LKTIHAGLEIQNIVDLEERNYISHVQFILYSTLREEHRLRMFENWVLRRIFRPKRDEVTGEQRKLHNK